MRDALLDPDFPLKRSAILKETPPGVEPQANQQYVHGFFLRKPGVLHVSDRLDVIRPAIDLLRPELLLRIKLNLTRKQASHVEYGLHVDTSHPGASTAILYFNSNNGYTVFEDGTRVDSVANRLVLFDARLRHTGASCTDADYRLVLNLNMVLGPSALVDDVADDHRVDRRATEHLERGGG